MISECTGMDEGLNTGTLGKVYECIAKTEHNQMETFHLNVKQEDPGSEHRVVDEQNKLPWEIRSAKTLLVYGLREKKRGRTHYLDLKGLGLSRKLRRIGPTLQNTILYKLIGRLMYLVIKLNGLFHSFFLISSSETSSLESAWSSRSSLP